MQYTAQELKEIKEKTHGYLNMTNLLIGNPEYPSTQNLLIQEKEVIKEIHKAATEQTMNLSSLETTTGKGASCRRGQLIKSCSRNQPLAGLPWRHPGEPVNQHCQRTGNERCRH